MYQNVPQDVIFNISDIPKKNNIGEILVSEYLFDDCVIKNISVSGMGVDRVETLNFLQQPDINISLLIWGM